MKFGNKELSESVSQFVVDEITKRIALMKEDISGKVNSTCTYSEFIEILIHAINTKTETTNEPSYEEVVDSTEDEGESFDD